MPGGVISKTGRDRKLHDFDSVCTRLDGLTLWVKELRSKVRVLEEEFIQGREETHRCMQDLHRFYMRDLKAEVAQMVSDLFVLLSQATGIEIEELHKSRTLHDLKEACQGTLGEPYLRNIPDGSTLLALVRDPRCKLTYQALDYDDPDPRLETVNSYFTHGVLREEGVRLVYTLVSLSGCTSQKGIQRGE